MSPEFFTRRHARFKVPHERIGVRWVLVAHLAVTRAFELIRERGWPLATALENEVTEMLEDVLENSVRNRGEVAGFNTGFFGKVTRGSETVSFNGTKISKKPDLLFALRREHRIGWDQRQDALFAECKPVDRAHPLNGHYCAIGKTYAGIERFIIGDYAWAMEEALMIGYVRDGFSIDPHLAAALNHTASRNSLGDPTPPEAIEVTASGDRVIVLHRTTHQRRFSWLDGRLASAIDLFHSWHDCT
jgi:hypothetical protein